MKLNVFHWLVATAALLALGLRQRHVPWSPSRVAGALVCCLAFGAVSLARYQLGRSFSVRAEARHLVTTGLYARLRNPIYVFAELFLLGLALYLIPLQVTRARREANVLEAAFGEEYRRYRARTWI